MKRRDFIKGTATTAAGAAMATAGATGFATPALAQGKKQWILVSSFGKAGILGRAIEGFASFVKTASNDRLAIQVYHVDELVGGLEVMDAVQSGTAQMGFGAPYYWQGKSKAIPFIAAMPFGLTAQEQNAYFYYGDGIAMADKVYNDLGTKFLPMGNTGNQMGGWYNKEITSVEDFNGLKYRMPGLGGEVLKTFGTNVVLLPGSEVLPALTSGAIDGTEWIGPAADLAKGLFKVCKYYYFPGWHEPATVLDGIFDLKEWEALDDELRAIVTHGAMASNMQVLSEFYARNDASMQKLIDAHGVSLKQYPDPVVSAIAERSKSVLSDIANSDPLAKEVYTHIMAFRETAMRWSGFSDGAFIQARNAAG